MTNTAKECPFCGNVELVMQDTPGLKNWVRMYCCQCRAYSSSMPRDYPGVEEGLIMRWHHRACIIGR